MGLFFLVDKLILLCKLLLLLLTPPGRLPPPPPPPPPLFKPRDVLFFFLGLLESEWLVPVRGTESASVGRLYILSQRVLRPYWLSMRRSQWVKCRGSLPTASGSSGSVRLECPRCRSPPQRPRPAATACCSENKSGIRLRPTTQKKSVSDAVLLLPFSVSLLL